MLCYVYEASTYCSTAQVRIALADDCTCGGISQTLPCSVTLLIRQNVGFVVFVSLHTCRSSTHSHAAVYSYVRPIVGTTHELDDRSRLIGPIPRTYGVAKLFGTRKGLCTNFAIVIH